MAKMSLEELRKLREKQQGSLQSRDTEGKDVHIIVGMGTCGIAAGAKETISAFMAKIGELGLDNIVIKQTGCMGLCYAEPTVEVRMPGMSNTIYGNVNAEVADQIIDKHIMNKTLVEDHIFNRPSGDITQ